MGATHLHERAKRNLQQAIVTMREACDAAERSCRDDKPADACQRVLHAFSWGLANASGSIQSAMSAIEDAHVVELAEARELKGAGKPAGGEAAKP